MLALPPITVFDIETTGLDPRKGHRIIEIAGMRLEEGVLKTDAAFASLVNPERDIPFEARQVNKLREEDVRLAPTIDSVLPKFLEFAAGSLLIAHNASFDYGFLECEKQYCWGYTELPECLCTMRLSQALYPQEFRHNLDIVSKRFNLQMPEARHRALADVMLTGQALLKMLETGRVRSVDDLRKFAGLRVLSK